MAKHKEIKTNAMRILDRNKIAYTVNTYECEEFVSGIAIADKLGQEHARTFKTLVTAGKSGGYFVFVIPLDKELDLKKAAQAVGEKSVEMIAVKDITRITGYIRGGCTPIGMKKEYLTVIHESAKDYEELIISGGRIGSQILIHPEDLLKVVSGIYADITA